MGKYIVAVIGDYCTTAERIKTIATNERDAQRVIGLMKKSGFVRIENCYWYETWKNPSGDLWELERAF